MHNIMHNYNLCCCHSTSDCLSECQCADEWVLMFRNLKNYNNYVHDL